jgi:hypothetical protein
MPEQHSDEIGACQLERIRTIASLCDNEYYMSAARSPIGSHNRAERGYARIQQWIRELQALKEEVSCPACQKEIESQLALQKEAIREIERLLGSTEL